MLHPAIWLPVVGGGLAWVTSVALLWTQSSAAYFAATDEINRAVWIAVVARQQAFPLDG